MHKPPPPLHNSDKGVTHDCASILDSIAKETYCFLYGASLHRQSFIFTLVAIYTTGYICAPFAIFACLVCGLGGGG